MNALQEAKKALQDYQYRLNSDGFRGTREERAAWADSAYQEGMLSAAIFQAEQLRHIADALENISGAYSIDLPEKSK